MLNFPVLCELSLCCPMEAEVALSLLTDTGTQCSALYCQSGVRIDRTHLILYCFYRWPFTAMSGLWAGALRGWCGQVGEIHPTADWHSGGRLGSTLHRLPQHHSAKWNLPHHTADDDVWCHILNLHGCTFWQYWCSWRTTWQQTSHRLKAVAVSTFNWTASLYLLWMWCEPERIFLVCFCFVCFSDWVHLLWYHTVSGGCPSTARDCNRKGCTLR